MRKSAKIYEEWLVLQCQTGDRQALSSLIQIWQPKLISQAYFQMKDGEGAKDVVQESWSAAIKSIHKLKDPAKFGSWMHRIVYLKSVDWIRQRQRERNEIENARKELFSISPETNEDQIKIVLKALEVMKPNEKMVLRLFYLDNQSIKEISEIMGIPLGSVKSKLFYAREHLKKLVKAKQYEKD